MKISLRACRKSKALRGELAPDAGRPDIPQGTQIYEFDVVLPQEQTVALLTDCKHKHAFDVIQLAKRPGYWRPCPLKPKPNAPPEKKAPQPTKRFFAVDMLRVCPTCKVRGATFIADAADKQRILSAFGQQLKVEDFSQNSELGELDRKVERWVVDWDSIKVY